VTGVLAHELGHVKNRDTLTMTVAATLSGAIGMLATFGGLFGGGRDENGRPMVSPIVAIAAMILAPLAASLVQMAISRSREFEADRAGAEISGNPLGLASALQRLHEGTQAIPNATVEANPATAHLYIDNPLSAGGMRSLFSTHPPMEERIAACRRWPASIAPRRRRRRCGAAARSRGPTADPGDNARAARPLWAMERG
jgi:heat shock protein HtpX